MLVMFFLASIPVQAENWLPLTGSETLRDFVSGATAEIEVRPGEVAIGEYRADGTATITVWNETFERTWEVRGDNQVCYSSLTETNCYTFERNVDVPGEYRAQHVGTGETILFRVSETDPRVVTRDSRPGAKGGLGAPSAGDIAGSEDRSTSITGGQYFYAINLRGGWQINGSPVYSYNHNAASGNNWTFPVAFGVAKTSIIGGRPWKFNLQYWHYLVSPDTFGPNHQIRISISPVVALPW